MASKACTVSCHCTGLQGLPAALASRIRWRVAKGGQGLLAASRSCWRVAKAGPGRPAALASLVCIYGLTWLLSMASCHCTPFPCARRTRGELSLSLLLFESISRGLAGQGRVACNPSHCACPVGARREEQVRALSLSVALNILLFLYFSSASPISRIILRPLLLSPSLSCSVSSSLSLILHLVV